MSHAPLPDSLTLLKETAAGWGISLSPEQVGQFATYAVALQQWNRRMNLTSVTDLASIVSRHFLDSLRCACSWGAVPQSLVDVGTGAGFPGLPLKIAFPTVQLTVIESVQKKGTFLEHVISLLGLEGVTLIGERAERVGHSPQQREQHDVAVARAVAELRVLAEYVLPLVRVGGRFLAPKGADVASEVAAAQHALVLLGGELVAVEPVIVPNEENRTLVVVEKIAPTPPTYPRAPGVPARRRLKEQK